MWPTKKKADWKVSFWVSIIDEKVSRDLKLVQCLYVGKACKHLQNGAEFWVS